jgi:small nuclear ribonucleoprotein F
MQREFESLTSKQLAPTNPKPFLQNLVGETVIVRLKWGNTEYHGDLMSTDSYMNLQLDRTEEVVDGESQGMLGQVLIRCNNVMWIAAKNQDLNRNGMVTD